jgi:death-on-curing protein
VDGNKRAGAMAALVFLDVNGVRKLPSPTEMERATLAIASGRMEKQALIDWMREAIG